MNNNDSSDVLLDEALNERFGVSENEGPSLEFRQRCRAAAFGALDVLKMQQHRPDMVDTPGSLLEHYKALARLAGVCLDNVFRALGITPADIPDAASAQGLAFLARQLGLAREEALLRLRWGFARLAGGVSPAAWLPVPVPVRGRHATSTVSKANDLEKALRQCEANYSPARRAELRAAINCFAQVYGQETASV
jgi:hypothetical protein